jgi:hypothetical protein
MFGWSATPAYYNVISGAISWAHNGGVSHRVLDMWAKEQGVVQNTLHTAQHNVRRSMTYVDDSFGSSTVFSVFKDMTDIKTIITKLLGKHAVNEKKTEGPAEILTLMGWECNMSTQRMRPSESGRKKIIWWLFRGVKLDQKEFKLSLAHLRKLVGLLRWYAAVIPFASTFALQGLLTAMERKAVGKTRINERLINIRSEALREIKHWRYVIGQSLSDDNFWSAPIWFLAKASSNQAEMEIWTDAATTIGGGYHLPLQENIDGSTGHFGQFLWSEEERLLFGTANLETTDINVLEFVTAILAIVTEREVLKGCIVRINVDNTAAISWLNKLRVKHEYGQVWVALLIYVMLEYNITIICIHIAGVANITADELSRFLKACHLRLRAEGYQLSTMPSTDSRLAIWKASLNECGETQMLIRQWLTQLA